MPTIDVHGVPAAYDEAGSGPGAALLLLHGHTGGRDDFVAVIQELAAQRRVVAVDLPGHGGTPGSGDPADYGLAATAAFVLDFAAAADLGEFHLLGHSLGGLVAQRVAAAASQRLRSLVLLSSGLGALREERAERVMAVATAIRDEGPDAALEVSLTGAPPVDDARRDALRRRFAQLQPAAVVGGARALITSVPLGAFLRGIDVPVLSVHAADDEVWNDAEQRLLAASIRGASRAVIAGAGHVPQVDQPRALVEALLPFLRDADP